MNKLAMHESYIKNEALKSEDEMHFHLFFYGSSLGYIWPRLFLNLDCSNGNIYDLSQFNYKSQGHTHFTYLGHK